MDHHSGFLAKVGAWLTYFFSGGLMLGDAMDWINDNTGVVGLVLGLISLAINWYYKHKESKQGDICEPS